MSYAAPDNGWPTRIVIKQSNGDTVLRVAGDLDLSTTDRLTTALADAITQTDRLLVIDLAECPFLCSRSYGAMEGAALYLRGRDAALMVSNVPPSFSLIAQVVGDDSPLAVAS